MTHHHHHQNNTSGTRTNTANAGFNVPTTSTGDIHFGTYNDVQGNQDNRVITNNTNIAGNQINIKKDSGASVPDALMRASITSATWDSQRWYSAPSCLPGTRVHILNKLQTWTRSPGDQRIFWLNGVSGLGKSSIAQSLAAAVNTETKLGASFFFSKDDAERSNHRALFTTLAYQLHLAWPFLKFWTKKTLRSNPSLPYSSPAEQLDKLIIEPLNCLEKRVFPRKVVIIDGLDECGEDDAMEEVVKLIMKVAEIPSVPILWVITSQTDRSISRNIQSPLTVPLDLITFDATPDIRMFYENRLAKLADKLALPKPWPLPAQLVELSQLTFGLFLYAMTVVKFIEARNANPRRQLAIVLSVDHTGPNYPYAELDRLYKRILTEIPSGEYQASVRDILGFVSLAAYPLKLQALDDLLRLQQGDTYISLQGLHAFLSIPDQDDNSDDATVRLVHVLFRQFLTRQERSGEFYIDPLVQNGRIAHDCLALMGRLLKRDICRIQDPHLLNKDVPDLARRRRELISPALEYACRHWSTHLKQATITDTLKADLQSFVQDPILSWIETLSLLEAVDVIVPSLREAVQTLQNSAPALAQALFRVETLVTPALTKVRDSALLVYYLPGSPPANATIETAPRLQAVQPIITDLPPPPPYTEAYSPQEEVPPGTATVPEYTPGNIPFPEDVVLPSREPSPVPRRTQNNHFDAFTCASCDKPITGYRFQCGPCSTRISCSYDLCQECIKSSPCAKHGFKVWYEIDKGEQLVSITGHCDKCESRQTGKEKFTRCFDCSPYRAVDWCGSCVDSGSLPAWHHADHRTGYLYSQLYEDHEELVIHEDSCPGNGCQGECRVCCSSCLTYIGQSFHFSCRTCSSHDTPVALCTACNRDLVAHGSHTFEVFSSGKARYRPFCDRCGAGIQEGDLWKRCVTCPPFPGTDLCTRCEREASNMGHRAHRLAKCLRSYE